MLAMFRFLLLGVTLATVVTACADTAALRALGPTDAASLSADPGPPPAGSSGTAFDNSSWAAQHGIRSWKDLILDFPGTPVEGEDGTSCTLDDLRRDGAYGWLIRDSESQF